MTLVIKCSVVLLVLFDPRLSMLLIIQWFVDYGSWIMRYGAANTKAKQSVTRSTLCLGIHAYVDVTTSPTHQIWLSFWSLFSSTMVTGVSCNQKTHHQHHIPCHHKCTSNIAWSAGRKLERGGERVRCVSLVGTAVCFVKQASVGVAEIDEVVRVGVAKHGVCRHGGARHGLAACRAVQNETKGKDDSAAKRPKPAVNVTAMSTVVRLWLTVHGSATQGHIVTDDTDTKDAPATKQLSRGAAVHRITSTYRCRRHRSCSCRGTRQSRVGSWRQAQLRRGGRLEISSVIRVRK